MMEAFRSLGIEVDVVSGYSSERAAAISRIERGLRQGVHYAFMYGESSTEPTLLTDRHHLPLHPTLNFGFFARLKARAMRARRVLSRHLLSHSQVMARRSRHGNARGPSCSIATTSGSTGGY